MIFKLLYAGVTVNPIRTTISTNMELFVEDTTTIIIITTATIRSIEPYSIPDRTKDE